jgi:hypothetical protein
VELISSDSKACHYAAIACVYMGRRLASGEFEHECSADRTTEYATCIEMILAALEEDRNGIA